MYRLITILLLLLPGIEGAITVKCKATSPASPKRVTCSCTNLGREGVVWGNDTTVLSYCIFSHKCSPGPRGYTFTIKQTEHMSSMTVNPYIYSDCQKFTCKDFRNTSIQQSQTPSTIDFDSTMPLVIEEPVSNNTDGDISITTSCISGHSDLIEEWYIVVNGTKKQYKPDPDIVIRQNITTTCTACNSESAAKIQLGFRHQEAVGNEALEGHFQLELHHPNYPSDKLVRTTTNVYKVVYFDVPKNRLQSFGGGFGGGFGVGVGVGVGVCLSFIALAITIIYIFNKCYRRKDRRSKAVVLQENRHTDDRRSKAVVLQENRHTDDRRSKAVVLQENRHTDDRRSKAVVLQENRHTDDKLVQTVETIPNENGLQELGKQRQDFKSYRVSEEMTIILEKLEGLISLDGRLTDPTHTHVSFLDCSDDSDSLRSIKEANGSPVVNTPAKVMYSRQDSTATYRSNELAPLIPKAKRQHEEKADSVRETDEIDEQPQDEIRQGEFENSLNKENAAAAGKDFDEKYDTPSKETLALQEGNITRASDEESGKICETRSNEYTNSSEKFQTDWSRETIRILNDLDGVRIKIKECKEAIEKIKNERHS